MTLPGAARGVTHLHKTTRKAEEEDVSAATQDSPASTSETTITDSAPLEAALEAASRPRRRRLGRRSTIVTAPSDPGDAGASLVEEAELLLAQRKWSKAEAMASSALRLRPDDASVLVIAAVAAANHGRGDRAFVEALRARSESATDDDESRAVAWGGLAQVALADRNYDAADVAARKAIDHAPRHSAGWWALGASFAALGWFDESAQCVDKAETLGAPPALAQWHVGRATNQWAMSKVPTTMVTLVSVLLLGFLGVAIAITTPFVFRDVRVAHLDSRSKYMAAMAWADQTALRLIGATAVLAVVIVWTAAQTLG